MGGRSRTPVAAVAGAVVLLALLSLILPSTATYDPWAWIIWGREVVHGDLNTIDGPSWKPLPVVVTALAAPLGSIAPTVWVLVARIGALAAVVVAFVLGRRIAGTLGGLLSAAPLLLAPWFFWHGWLANSEGLLVAFVLAAVIAELDGRRGLAMTWGVAAGLLRPEAWPFLLLYAAWVAWHAGWRGRFGVLAGLAILPLAWLVPEKWGSGDYFRASTRAQNPDPGAPALTEHPWLTVVRNFARMIPTTTWVMFGAAVLLLVALTVLARRRAAAADGTSTPAGAAPPDADAPGSALAARDAPDGTTRAFGPASAVQAPWLVVGALAVLGVAWLVLVAIMTERGYSGNERYLIQPAAFLIVAAGCALALALRGLQEAPRRVILGALAVLVVATAVQQLPMQVRRVVYEGNLVHELPRAIDAAGGRERLQACGGISTLNLMVPQVAWQLRMHAVDVRDAKYRRTPVVLRVRLLEGDILRPSVGRVPALPVLARTEHWQIEARSCPPTPGGER
jgi:hypothetical protein